MDRGRHAAILAGEAMMVVQGDCLDVMKGMEPGSVDLVYLDPPFNSGRDYAGDAGEFRDTWSSMAEYLDFIRERLVEVNRILHPETGSVYLHCDDTAVHRLRCVMDDVFGVRKFRGNVLWKRRVNANIATKFFTKMTDHILCFGASGAVFNVQYERSDPEYIDEYFKHNDGDGRGPYSLVPLFHPVKGYYYEWKGFRVPDKGWVCPARTMKRYDDEGLIHYPPNLSSLISRKQFLSDWPGKKIGNLWTDIPTLAGASDEMVGYPTQKPLALLGRIISASSAPGDMVFDPFMGSGTTLVAARRLGRRCAGCDISPDAVAVAKRRLDEATDLFTEEAA